MAVELYVEKVVGYDYHFQPIRKPGTKNVRTGEHIPRPRDREIKAKITHVAVQQGRKGVSFSVYDADTGDHLGHTFDDRNFGRDNLKKFVQAIDPDAKVMLR